MSRERESVALYGARVDITESMAGWARPSRRRARCQRDRVFLPEQSRTPRTRRRIVAAPTGDRGAPTAASTCRGRVGTGGTITGVGEHLREHVNPRLLVVPSSGTRRALGRRPGPHRIQGIGAGFVPSVLNRRSSTSDRGIRRGRDPDAWACARRGVLAAFCGARCGRTQVAQRPESARKRIVVMMPDSGERYVRSPSSRRSVARHAPAGSWGGLHRRYA